MAEFLIVSSSVVSIFAVLAGVVLVVVYWKRETHVDIRLLLLGLLAATLFHGLSNFFEWTRTAGIIDSFEDYVELLVPALWGSLFYAFLQEQSRSELQRSEQRYRSLTDDVLDTTSAGICILDVERRIVWINQALERYLGLSREELVGCKKCDLVDRVLKHRFENPQEWARRMASACENRRPVEFECHVLPGEGRRERWLEYRSREVTSGLYRGGCVEHYYDITERTTTARHREELLDRVEAQKAELERFTYTVSHDLKSPLITITGYLGVLKEDLATRQIDQAGDDIDRIARAAEKMQRLLAELLDLAKIGRETSSAERVELSDVIHEALELLQGKFESREISVAICAATATVDGHRNRLVEVFQNLLDNAVKYLGDQAEPKIEIRAEERGGEMLCSVRDNGMGVKPEYAHRVFDLFEQLDSNEEGTGVGLAIVKRIVETHGGRIWLESEGPGRGTTFFFTIPCGGGAQGL